MSVMHQPQATPRSSGRAAWVGPVAAAGAVGAATLYTAIVDPNTSGAFPQCITKVFTGLDCPMCGGLRAVHSLAHGDLIGAIDHNLLAVILLPAVVAAWGWWLARSLGAEPPSVRWPRWAPWAGIALALAFAVVRNTALPGMEWLDSA